MTMQVVCRASDQALEGPAMETYTIDVARGEVPAVLVTRDSDGSDRLVCGPSMEALVARYRQAPKRTPDGRVWCDAGDLLDPLGRALTMLFAIEDAPVDLDDAWDVADALVEAQHGARLARGGTDDAE